MCVKCKPTTTARKVAIATRNVAFAQARQPQSTENPFRFGGGHNVLPLWLPLWLLLWQTVQYVMPVSGGAVPVINIVFRINL
jgi:hypothetical protein